MGTQGCPHSKRVSEVKTPQPNKAVPHGMTQRNPEQLILDKPETLVMQQTHDAQRSQDEEKKQQNY